MDKNEFAKRLASVPVAKPDSIDRRLLAEIDAEHEADDEGRNLHDVIAEREYNGKILLRLPKEFHAELTRTAREQGVSLNQYCLYKLAH